MMLGWHVPEDATTLSLGKVVQIAEGRRKKQRLKLNAKKVNKLGLTFPELIFTL